MGSSPTRGSSFFLGKVTALGVLCCFALFVCLTLLASFFHLSFKNMYILPLTSVVIIIIYTYICRCAWFSKSSVFLFGKSTSTKLKYCLAQIISHVQKLFSEYTDLD